MPAKKRGQRKSRKDGKARPPSKNQWMRVDPIPAVDYDDSDHPPTAPGSRSLKPYVRPLLTGCPYDVDDLENPECTGVYGRPMDWAPWTDNDPDGIPILTEFLKRSYDWQIECWERECRELLAKYGCGVDPRDPVPSPPPNQ